MLGTLMKINCPHTKDVIGFDWQARLNHDTANILNDYLDVDPDAPLYPPFAINALTDTRDEDKQEITR